LLRDLDDERHGRDSRSGDSDVVRLHHNRQAIDGFGEPTHSSRNLDPAVQKSAERRL
jgi:hypothetical protein